MIVLYSYYYQHTLHTLILSLPPPSDVRIEADNVDIEANDDIIIDSGGNVTIDASNDVDIDSGITTNIKGGDVFIDAFAQGGTGPTAGGNINLGADVGVKVHVTGDFAVNTNGGDFTVDGSTVLP